MNVKLFRRVQKAITEEALRMDMRTFGRSCRLPRSANDAKYYPSCNTVGCIAAWGLILTKKTRKSEFSKYIPHLRRLYRIEQSAARVFGIGVVEGEQLFYVRNWPPKFQARIQFLTPGTQKYVRVVCARINHFIESGE